MKVLIVRHGIAVERGTPPFERDEERPLTPKGAERMKQAAAGIVRAVEAIETVFASPLVRARETADILARAIIATMRAPQ